MYPSVFPHYHCRSNDSDLSGAAEYGLWWERENYLWQARKYRNGLQRLVDIALYMSASFADLGRKLKHGPRPTAGNDLWWQAENFPWLQVASDLGLAEENGGDLW